MARVIVATANKQSADTARRVRRKHHAMQRQGIPAGGTRPYGYQADRRTLDEAEAAVVREIVQRFLAGVPLTGIATDLNRRGIRTGSGKEWRPPTLKVILRNPRICGYRNRTVLETDPETGRTTRRNETVLDANGSPVIGQWEPIIEVKEWRAVIALFDGNRAKSYGDNTRKYLLSGILRCGNNDCGTKMRGSMRVEAGQQVHYYQCPSTGLGGCGGVAINGMKADEFISEAVISKFELETARRDAEAAPATWPSESALTEVQARIAELTAGWRARPQKISTARFYALLPELEAEERALKAEEDEWLAGQMLAAQKPLNIRDDWYAGRLTLHERRAYVQRALVAVIVAPVEGARGRWNPDRMTPVWRTAQ
jgi:hypothetical protein